MKKQLLITAVKHYIQSTETENTQQYNLELENRVLKSDMATYMMAVSRAALWLTVDSASVVWLWCCGDTG